MAKITYKDAGVDVERGYEAVKLMKAHAKKTCGAEVLGDLGSFAGMYQINDEDVLVSGTDGVATKLKIAITLDKHDTVGIDCVAMCVNDVVCHGARPLFFLDYIATGALDPKTAAEIVKGVSEGCMQSGSALIGGETAEMPGFYAAGDYDMAGFSVGIVKKSEIINGSKIKPGDAIIGLKSSGVHSNGFSLVRRVFDINKNALSEYDEKLGMTIGEKLITPTKIYVKTILALKDKFDVKGIAHITGGGLIENVPRMLPAEGSHAVIDLSAWELPRIFEMIMERADLDMNDACNTFNMGIGMAVALPADQAQAAIDFINDETDDEALLIGEIVPGDKGVSFK